MERERKEQPVRITATCTGCNWYMNTETDRDPENIKAEKLSIEVEAKMHEDSTGHIVFVITKR